MPTIAAVVFCALLAALAAFQIALIAGAPLGRLAWGGQDRVLPPAKRRGSAIAVILYLVFALLALESVGVTELLPSAADVAVQVAMWVVAVYLALGIVMNLASKSRVERAVMTPTAIVLAVLAFVVAAN
jgi:hypothetical protein